MKTEQQILPQGFNSEFSWSLPHLFEFMDQSWLPGSLHTTLREILECGCSQPFRPYYKHVADTVREIAIKEGFTHVVELGAGTAPVTRLLAKSVLPGNIKLIPCDINPNLSSYKEMEIRNPGKITPIYSPVDFSMTCNWPANSLLVLSATFHHLSPSIRSATIRSLSDSGRRVVVFECLRKNFLSIFLVLFNFIPVLLLPILFFKRSGKLRRFIWCWCIPLALPLIIWDGIVSSLRMWSNETWLATLKINTGLDRVPKIKTGIFNQMVSW